LISLSSSGSIEQFSHCGLCTIKDQFKLKRLVEASAANQVMSNTCTPAVTSIGCTHAVKNEKQSVVKDEKQKAGRRKLTRVEIDNLGEPKKNLFDDVRHTYVYV